MLASRGCAKTSTIYNGSTRYYCSTHNHEMTNEQWQCSFGAFENFLIGQLNTQFAHFDLRVQMLENKITERLVEFGKNLEKLHERDP